MADEAMAVGRWSLAVGRWPEKKLLVAGHFRQSVKKPAWLRRDTVGTVAFELFHYRGTPAFRLTFNHKTL